MQRRPPRRWTRLALGAATLMVAAPALAASSAAVTLENFYWKLTDLDLNDGVSPSLTMHYSTGDSGSYIDLYSGETHLEGDVTVDGSFKDTAKSLSKAWGQGSATSGATVSSAQASVQGSLGKDGKPVRNSVEAMASPAIAYWGSKFTLSANTSAVLVLVASGWAKTTVGSDGSLSESAGAYLGLGYSMEGWGGAFDSTELGVGAAAVATGSGFSGEFKSFSDALSMVVVNDEPAARKVWLDIVVQAKARSPFVSGFSGFSSVGSVSAVPEPGLVWLWLAGGAGVVGWARRRQAVHQ